MTGDWTAVAVRARGLAARRLGRIGARAVAKSGSLDEAIGALSRTPYGRDVRPGMDLVAAEHAIMSTFLWHLRVLAGWAPSRGLDRVRLLAAGFEIANVLGRLAHLEGRRALAPYELGALSSVWSSVAQGASPEALRQALSVSAWGDPGGTDLPLVGVALQAAWARRVVFGVPEGGGWGRILAGLLLARMLAAGMPPVAGTAVDRNLRLVLGGRWEGVRSLDDLARTLPRAAAHALAEVRDVADLWRAEARAWSLIEADALQLQAGWRPGPAAVVAGAGLLAVDAWRARAALEAAARGGELPDEVVDVVA